MFSSTSSAAWSPGLPPDRAESRSPPDVSPAATTRRRRGLSYLRSYTHNHILSRDNRDSSSRTSPTRAADSLSPATTTSPSNGTAAAASPTPTDPPQSASPAFQRRTTQLPVTISSEVHTPEPPNSLLTAVSELCVVPARILGAASSALGPSSSSALSSNTQTTTDPDLTTHMARTRATTASNLTDMAQQESRVASRPGKTAPSTARGQEGTQGTSHQMPTIRFIPHQDPRAQRPSLVFSPQTRILPTGKEVIKVGRWSERDNRLPPVTNSLSAAPVGFKSKVVSRRHCEFWFSEDRWFIMDVKSSSGTFLNHIRLSSPGTESKPYPIHDGDIVQLGIDFKGGEEMIFRCVKIRIELNKGLQNNTPSSFNVQSHKLLQQLNNHGKPVAGSSSQDCSICLGPIAPCQSLFVAPCSHTWHYKCIRVIVNGPHWPHFICPNCRTVADLEAELDDQSADGEWEQVEAVDPNTTVERARSTTPTRAARLGDTSEATDATPQAVSEEASQNQTSHGDGDEVIETSDSDNSPGIQHSIEGMSYLNMDDSPIRTTHSPAFPEISNSTVLPVDIATSAGSPSRLQNPETRARRGTVVRTPSPNGLSASVPDVVPSSEGPMTPRNDAGPFIFDGSAGRLADIAPPEPERDPTL